MALATSLHAQAKSRSLSRLLIAGFAMSGMIAIAPTVRAQQLPGSDAPFEAAKAAFEALPEVDRRALQDALIWTGDYKSVVDGEFGRGTRDAVIAFAKRARVSPDGALDQKGRAMAIAAGARARNAQLFRKIIDPRSGAAVGLATKFLTKRIDTRTGSKWSAADGSASLDTFQNPESQGDLPGLFESLRADAPGRRVSYRVLRPDFFVVSGEDQDRLFYTRAERGAVNGVATVRGYTLSYAKALRPSFEIVAIATANAFDPFPAAAPAIAGAPAAPAAASAQLEASAIAIAPGMFLSVTGGDCKEPKIGARPASVSRRDPATGLTLIEARGADTAAMTPTAITPAARAPAGGDTVVALFVSQWGARGAETSVATGDYLAPVATGAPPRLVAALQGNIGGSAVFDRSGALVAMARAPSSAPRRIAGIIPQSAWALVPAAAISAFLDAAGVKPAAAAATTNGKSTAGEVAALRGRSIAALTCLR